ncbi:uncharacterized protein LOC141620688 [Silene latifolia]|uniref:uncharacterized protein LOC141620688 n=1 Tax=Silene latifolia TaxID=37657 RepID=UPI003D76BB07
MEQKRKQLARLSVGARTVEELRQRKKLVAEIATLRRQEEQYWRQRSRALWLKDGDRNTNFFHMRAGERKRKNYISKLIDDGGVEKAGNDAVAGVAIEYFRHIFTLSNPANFDELLQGLEGRVTDRMNVGLRGNYREEEVVEALNQMHPLKAPDPDDMNALFYQSFWHIIGPDVVKTVMGILRVSFFARANVNEATVVNDILRSYEAASGQLVNLDKTMVSFSRGVTDAMRGRVTECLGVTEVVEQERYLGLPTVIGLSKKVITNILRDKLSKILQGWRRKILSRAGKEVFIKAVANSLSTYVMSVFKIPANFCNELHSMVSRFWWGHREGKRGISWVA